MVFVVKSRDLLLDVSRLLWRAWDRKLPTGIDRVCLEYIRRFGSRSRGVVQFRGFTRVLSSQDSARLFAILGESNSAIRTRLLLLLPLALARSKPSPPRSGMVYLNVGHTGLHDIALPTWISSNGVKAVYLIHDLIPIIHPQFCRPGEQAKHALRIEHALRSASGIIVNSRATLDSLNVFAASRGLPVPPARVAWISGYRKPNEVRPRIFERPHFIMIGTVEGRKNHILRLEVWRRLVLSMGSDAPILMIIGQRGWEAEAATAILDAPDKLEPHVRELGKCSDDDLHGLLAGARALLMPSFIEGFGLPVIEAIKAGTPVVATDLPVYREIVGDIPYYLDPVDMGGWEAAIKILLQDGPERARQIRAMESFAGPTWDGHFAAVEALLDEIAIR
jgi:glycosyltransferase involved in cell wall biosynthesis